MDYKRRSELIKALSEQQYFDARLKKDESESARIGDRDGRTGRHLVLRQDGGVTSNGVPTSNAAPPSDGFVKRGESGNSNAISLAWRGYSANKITKRNIEDEKLESQIIFLFQKDQKLYIGGDRDELVLIYETETGFSILDARIDKTGSGIDDYIVTFIVTPSNNRSYQVCAYSAGILFTKDYTIEEQSNILIGSLGFYHLQHGFFNNNSGQVYRTPPILTCQNLAPRNSGSSFLTTGLYPSLSFIEGNGGNRTWNFIVVQTTMYGIRYFPLFNNGGYTSLSVFSVLEGELEAVYITSSDYLTPVLLDDSYGGFEAGLTPDGWNYIYRSSANVSHLGNTSPTLSTYSILPCEGSQPPAEFWRPANRTGNAANWTSFVDVLGSANIANTTTTSTYDESPPDDWFLRPSPQINLGDLSFTLSPSLSVNANQRVGESEYSMTALSLDRQAALLKKRFNIEDGKDILFLQNGATEQLFSSTDFVIPDNVFNVSDPRKTTSLNYGNIVNGIMYKVTDYQYRDNDDEINSTIAVLSITLAETPDFTATKIEHTPIPTDFESSIVSASAYLL